jgi:hypothetical protein
VTALHWQTHFCRHSTNGVETTECCSCVFLGVWMLKFSHLLPHVATCNKVRWQDDTCFFISVNISLIVSCGTTQLGPASLYAECAVSVRTRVRSDATDMSASERVRWALLAAGFWFSEWIKILLRCESALNANGVRIKTLHRFPIDGHKKRTLQLREWSVCIFVNITKYFCVPLWLIMIDLFILPSIHTTNNWVIDY